MKEFKVKWINRALTLYTVFSRHLKKNKPLDAEMEFQRIAIYSTTALGDLMFNTPAIYALKQRYPNASFALVSSEKNRPLVAGSTWFDDVFYWDNKIRNAHRLIKSLRGFKPQLTVILHSYMPYDILCAVLSKTEYIIRDQYRVDNPLMNRWLNARSEFYDEHLIQRKLNMLTPLGCDNTASEMHIPVAFPAGVSNEGKFRIGFQMGASEAKRCWPVKHFAELAKLLGQTGNYQIVLIGGPKELNLVNHFQQATGADIFAQVENKVGKTSLSELLTLIDGLDVLVTGDTGPLHLAIALKTATVSLYADANPKHTGPFQDMKCHIVMKLSDLKTESKQPLEKISSEAVSIEVMKLCE